MTNGLGVDLQGYLRAIRKGWWIIVSTAIVGGGLGALVNYQSTPQYASTVTFFISTPTQGGGSALSADQFATRRITSYVGLLSSDIVAQRIIDKTGIDQTAGQVRKEIVGDADLNTVLLTATVTDPSPQNSIVIAGAIASEFGKIVDQVDPIGPSQVVLRVISGPTLNSVPVSPRKSLNLTIGIVGGLVVGIIIALLRQILDTTIRSPQAMRALSDSPVLGVVPFERNAKKSPLITESQTRSIRAESFRQLRTNLHFLEVERRIQVMVVTSSMAEEGKSTTAINLGLAFSDSGRKVLLIEGDLRRPRIAHYLGLEVAVGLTNVLAGEVGLESVLQPWGRADMTVMTSGTLPPNPSELLGSPAMSVLVAELRNDFDIIIIDTPPLLPVTDAAVASALADGVVVVVRHAKTTVNQVTQSLRSLHAVDARVLGMILNMTPTKGSDAYASYGYYQLDPARTVPAETTERERRPDRLPYSSVASPGDSAGSTSRLRTGLRIPSRSRGRATLERASDPSSTSSQLTTDRPGPNSEKA